MSGGEFELLRASAAGMEAERSALDLAARNVAASQATADRGTFERLVPRFALGAPVSDADEPSDVPGGDAAAWDAPAWAAPAGLDADPADPSDAPDVPIRYLGARSEPAAGVDAVTEMVAVLDAQRAYEANASVFDIGKRLAERTIDLGRGQ